MHCDPPFRVADTTRWGVRAALAPGQALRPAALFVGDRVHLPSESPIRAFLQMMTSMNKHMSEPLAMRNLTYPDCTFRIAATPVFPPVLRRPPSYRTERLRASVFVLVVFEAQSSPLFAIDDDEIEAFI